MLFAVILLFRVENTFGSGTLGNEFLVSLPGMLVPAKEKKKFPRINFNLITLEFLTKVHMSTEWYNRANGNLKRVLYLEKGFVNKFSLPPNYLFGLATGMRWSFHFFSHLNFSVTVELFHNAVSGATLQLLPVAAWGETYFAVTLTFRPIIIVTTAVGPNNVKFLIKAHYPRRLIIDVGQAKLTHNSIHQIVLYAYQSYALSVCDNSTEVGQITGTEIKGFYPIGVVSGNCYSGTQITYCEGDAVDEDGDGDVLAEMLMPAEAYGSDFITFDVLKRRYQGHYVFVASANDTKVTVYTIEHNRFVRLEILLKFKGNWKSMPLPVQRIYSSHPIQLVLIQQSPCLEPKERRNNILHEEGGPTLSIIVPTNLFYFEYTWGTPYELGDHHYINLVVKSRYKDYFFYNGVQTNFKLRWRKVFDPLNISHWKTGMVSAMSHQQHFLHNTKTSFGCYLYGFNDDSAYMNPVGYVAAHINTYCVGSMKTMKIDDLTDNDCDLRIDEELANGIDDDNDRYVDEDLRSEKYIPTHTTTLATSDGKLPTTPFPLTTALTTDTIITTPSTQMTEMTEAVTTLATNTTSTRSSRSTQSSRKVTETPRLTRASTTSTTIFSLYNYTHWSIWQCDESCYETRQKRSRKCLSDECTEQEIQWRDYYCYLNQTCPKLCAEYTWGLNCRNSCVNCMGDCDKFNGSCKLCLPFYSAPENGCQSLIVGVWQSWTCSSDCNNTNQLRERICQKSLNECTTIEWRNASCHKNICPKDCLPGRWGHNCGYLCPNCDGDCDKFNGTCKRCKPGFKNPKAGCVEDCDRFTYGKDCRGNCLKKCDSDDCAERKIGICPVHGRYGEWNNWHCTRNCMETRMSRERSCDKPPPSRGGLQCKGNSQEWKASSCYLPVDRLCPRDCPEGKWGVDCEQKCSNCMEDCDKFYGNCTRCKRGFKFPDLSCEKACDPNEFGYNCLGNCHAKCGSDCKERVHGHCKDPSTILIASIFVVFVAILIVVCLIRRNMASDNSVGQSED